MAESQHQLTIIGAGDGRRSGLCSCSEFIYTDIDVDTIADAHAQHRIGLLHPSLFDQEALR